MKKMLSLLIIVLVFVGCIGGNAIADSFSLRNGISFGDSMEDVKNKETIAIEKIDEKIDENDSDEDYPYMIKTKEDTIAGIPGSFIYYNFDRDKKLRQVGYTFDGHTSKDLTANDYDNVNQGLIRKYGNPLGLSNGTTYIFQGDTINNAVLGYSLFKLLGGIGDICDYDEWVVNCDDYNVKIEHVYYYWGKSYSEINYSHSLSYDYFTDEQLKNKQDEKQERQDAVDNDI